MRIRDARAGDAGAIDALERQCFADPWPEEAVAAYINGGNCLMLCAEGEGGELLGYVGMQHVLDEGYIGNVCTAPQHRRRGVARALLAELEARSRRLGLAFLTLEARASNAAAIALQTLEARSSNAAAIALYEGAGYERVGTRPGYYQHPAEDAVIMTLFLKEGRT